MPKKKKVTLQPKKERDKKHVYCKQKKQRKKVKILRKQKMRFGFQESEVSNSRKALLLKPYHVLS
jgi:hypothetical protein